MGLPSAGLRTTQNILAAELQFNEILIIRLCAKASLYLRLQ